MLEKTHIDNTFQWKPPSDLLKIAKKVTAEYNRQYSSKYTNMEVLRQFSIQ